MSVTAAQHQSRLNLDLAVCILKRPARPRGIVADLEIPFSVAPAAPSWLPVWISQTVRFIKVFCFFFNEIFCADFVPAWSSVAMKPKNYAL